MKKWLLSPKVYWPSLIALICIVLLVITFVVVGVANNVGQKYLSKAKKDVKQSDKLRDAEFAVVLLRSNDANQEAAAAAAMLGDYALSAKYYQECQNDNCYIGLAKAKYNIGDYGYIVDNLVSKISHVTPDGPGILLETYLKQGNLTQARTMLPRCTKELQNQLGKLLETGNIDYRQTYIELNNSGFPQAALSLLREGFKADKLDRDTLLVLSQAQIDGGTYDQARTTLLKTIEIDKYYPQSYRQLILVDKKLGNTTDVNKYQDFLSNLTW